MAAARSKRLIRQEGLRTRQGIIKGKKLKLEVEVQDHSKARI